MAFLLTFTAYQSYELVVAFTWGMLLPMVFDIFIVWLTWHAYRAHRAHSTSATEGVDAVPSEHSLLRPK
ncbi:hypothetical protein CVS30_08890 [Arthrobacter psychrolactophilus]|uniref:Uncharacterized protein n=1 Tax=Arthrobacter psychrolactophilus TaxID=92442 RepID=A0A2V5IQ19_9MICC|nr:hypothetical protein [Arthrobacter psychrolactophilus]PYI38665.1 hypothetical protein CVS30_08890 [Arthrobacter psychrolactophilus]